MVKLLLEHHASLIAEDKKQKIAAIHITVRTAFALLALRRPDASTCRQTRGSWTLFASF